MPAFADASVVDSEAVSEYMQNQFQSIKPTAAAAASGADRAASQQSLDADDYLAPVSCSATPTPIPLGATPTPIPLGAPPCFYPVSAEDAANEEPLYHEIPGRSPSFL